MNRQVVFTISYSSIHNPYPWKNPERGRHTDDSMWKQTETKTWKSLICPREQLTTAEIQTVARSVPTISSTLWKLGSESTKIKGIKVSKNIFLVNKRHSLEQKDNLAPWRIASRLRQDAEDLLDWARLQTVLLSSPRGGAPLLSSPAPKSKVTSHAQPHAALMIWTSIYRSSLRGNWECRESFHPLRYLSACSETRLDEKDRWLRCRETRIDDVAMETKETLKLERYQVSS
jgi:hypothetical protein